MDLSLRKSISLPFKHHSCQKIPSFSSSFLGEHHPILPHHHHHHHHHLNDDGDATGHPMTSSGHQVIVNIDPSNDLQTKTPQNNNGNITSLYNNNNNNNNKEEKEESFSTTPTTSMDFSFRRTMVDPTSSSSSPPSELILGKFLEHEQQRVSGDMSLDIDHVDVPHHQLINPNENNNNHNIINHHHIRRQGLLQGLPPLPPDCMSRQSLSRCQSDVHSPDVASANTRLTHILNTHSNSHNSNNYMDGSREARVSFQESFDSDPHRVHDVHDDDDDGDDDDSDDDDDDVSTSKASDVHLRHDHVQDEEHGGSARIMMGDHGMHVHRRKSRTSSNANYKDMNHISNNNYEFFRGDDHHAEVVRCTSNNSSSRKMLSSGVTISKTKSRLMDPPATPLDQRSTSGIIPKSGQIMSNNTKSGMLGKSSNTLDEEEDDPFLEDDFPDEFKAGQIGTLVVLEWVSLVILIGSLVCSLIIPVLRPKTIWKLKLWKWEVFGLSLVCGRLVSGWWIKLLVFFIERNFLLRKRVLYFVYGLKKAVQNVIWLGLVLLTWHCIFNRQVQTNENSEPLKIVTKLVVIGEVGAVLWLLKTLMVKVLASSFHVKAFFERIQESLFNQFVIETLSAPPLFELRSTQEEEERVIDEVQMLQNAGLNIPPELKASVFSRTKSGIALQHLNSQGSKTLGAAAASTPPFKSPIRQSIGYSGPIGKKYHEEGITIDRLHKLNQQNVSAWNMKRLIRIVRHGFLTTLDEHIENTNGEDESATQIRSEVEAKAAARKIFRNVAKPRSKYIYLSDLMRFMQEDEALKTMSLFEGASEAERISKSSLKNWVVHAFRERRALALTLSDTKTAVNKLHKIVDVIVSIIMLLITCIALSIITPRSVVFLSSQVVVVAFVFGNTCKNVFESIIFLFVIHPFDVGDRCEIDAVQMVVEEMNILTTVFLRYDNQKIIYPNYILLSKPIHNFYRSPDMGDAVEFCLHLATPPEKIALIKQRITCYIVNKKEHWYPDPMIVLKDAESLYMLRIAVWVTHRMNFQDMGERWVRRAHLVEECIKIFRELDIEYRTYPVNVNGMPPMCFPPPTWGADPYLAEGAKEVVHN
ncbi:mechanosensitive ion channel protein 6 [Beta vulgaris subsp. vulgaris]|uniref:mechanosensitive ion channel protein 6 n=1 Tax=Beta vulgaris subsp. vulgaris TaxID=3555 RepID=UPI002036A40E|nr:mechanosensitive ion channel protein 6 [Beta vulgaris subsp. vulgaris]